MTEVTPTEPPAAGDAASIAVERRIEWSDTDPAGIMHNGALWRLVEAAEAVLHDRLGIRERTFGATPRVRVVAEFSRELRFHDIVTVELSVGKLGRTSVTYRFTVSRDGETAAQGEVVAVFVDGSGATPWPDAWRHDLLHAGPQRPERIT